MANWRSEAITEGRPTGGVDVVGMGLRGGRRGGAEDILSWSTEAGRRFKRELCGRVCGGEVEALSGGIGASAGRSGTGTRIRWSGGVVEFPRGSAGLCTSAG